MEMFFGLIGGLAVFIFGMQAIASGLQQVAGKRMRYILEKLTGIPIIGVLGRRIGDFCHTEFQSYDSYGRRFCQCRPDDFKTSHLSNHGGQYRYHRDRANNFI